VGAQPFAVLLADDLIDPTVSLLTMMIAEADRTGGSVIAAMDVGPREIAMYGCVDPGERDGDLVRVAGVVEKPAPDEAPSSLAVIGRYVFTPRIFDALERTPPGKGDEIQLTDAIQLLAAEEPVFAFPFESGRFDVGNPLDAMKAQIALALARDDIGADLRAWLDAWLPGSSPAG
jgi:UTP--glucose-1-phosphate uridylyltransferase